MSLSFCLRFIRPVGSMGLWVVRSRRAVLGKACFYDTEAWVAVPVHVIPAAKVCRAGGKRCMEASSEIRLKFGGKKPKEQTKNHLQKAPTKTPKTTKNQTEQLPEDNQRSNRNQETGFHHVHSIQSAIDGLRIWFCICMLAKAYLLLMGFYGGPWVFKWKPRMRLRPWFVFAWVHRVQNVSHGRMTDKTGKECSS